MLGNGAAADESGASRRFVHVLPDDADQNGVAVVLLAEARVSGALCDDVLD